MAAVATPPLGLAGIETLLKRLLLSALALPRPVLGEIETMLECPVALGTGTGTGVTTPVGTHGFGNGVATSATAGHAWVGSPDESGSGGLRLDYGGVFFMWQVRPWSRKKVDGQYLMISPDQ